MNVYRHVQEYGILLILFFGRLPMLLLFVCLFVWGFSSNSRIFHSYTDMTIASEGLQTLIYTRHSWVLSNEGFFYHATPTVTNGHLRELVTLTRLAVEFVNTLHG